jgi:multidrug efflux system membrane fusion protein
LSANDSVVTTGFANLSDGAKVIVGKEEQTPSADLAPRKKGSRGPQAKDSPKDSPTKDGAASDALGKDAQGKDGERRKRRSQSEGDPSGGGAKAQP